MRTLIAGACLYALIAFAQETGVRLHDQYVGAFIAVLITSGIAMSVWQDILEVTRRKK